MNKKIIIILAITIFLGLIAWIILSIMSDGKLDVLKNIKQDKETTEFSDDLALVLAKSENIESLKYQVEINDGQETNTMLFWQNQQKIRMEMSVQGQETVFLTDQETSYMFFPIQNMATKIDVSESRDITENSIVEQSLRLLDYAPAVLGSEKIDDKDCLVVQYAIYGQEIKMWIWEEYGLPIKTETLTEQGLMVHQVKNIEFVEIPDSVFQLPPEIEITEMPVFY